MTPPCSPECAGGHACVLGECRCAGGPACAPSEVCDGSGCVPIACDPVCDDGETCDSGACRCGGGTACLDGERCDGMRCVPTACTPACVGAETCVAGACVCGAGPSCSAGYACDGTSCGDVDECALATDDCATNATCTNTEGAFACTCDEGFVGDGRTCQPAPNCVEMPGVCDSNATCDVSGAEPRCVCDAGYRGDGTTCADVDECAEGSDDCDPNGICRNTAPGFTCECGVSFTGDGRACTPIAGCTSIDSFEVFSSWPLDPWVEFPPFHGVVTSAQRYDGSLSIASAHWAYRDDVVVGLPGDRLEFWVRTAGEAGQQVGVGFHALDTGARDLRVDAEHGTISLGESEGYAHPAPRTVRESESLSGWSSHTLVPSRGRVRRCEHRRRSRLRGRRFVARRSDGHIPDRQPGFGRVLPRQRREHP